MNKHPGRAALGGICALIIGLGSIGAGVATASAAPSDQSSAAKTSIDTSRNYTLSDVTGSTIAPQTTSRTNDETTAKQDAPDVASSKNATLPSDITIGDFGTITNLGNAAKAKADAQAVNPNTQGIQNGVRMGDAAPDDVSGSAPVDGDAAKDSGAKAQLTVTPSSTSRKELAQQRAIAIRATGFQPNESVRLEMAGPGEDYYNMTYFFKANATPSGQFVRTVSYLDASFARPGEYKVRLTGDLSGRVAEGSYTIVADPADPQPGSATISVANAEINQYDFWLSGNKFTVSGLKPKENVTVYAVTALGDASAITNGAQADANGDYSDGVQASILHSATGEIRLVVKGEESGYAYASFTVTPDDDPVAAAKENKNLRMEVLTPRISQYAMATQGAKFKVSGFKPNEAITMVFYSTDGFPTVYTAPSADKDGVMNAAMYDTSMKAPVGTYRMRFIGAESGYVEGTYEVFDDTSVKIDPKLTPTGELAKHLKDGVVTMTPRQILADHAISFKGSGYVPGDFAEAWIITPSGAQLSTTSYLVDQDGNFEETGSWWQGAYNLGNITGYDTALIPGTYTLLVFDHYDQSDIYAQLPIQITENDDLQPGDFSVTADPASLNSYEFCRTGVTLKVSGLEPNEKGSLLITAPDGTVLAGSTLTLDATGGYEGHLKVNKPSVAQQGGDYTVSFYTLDNTKQSATFTVDDAANPPEATIDIAPSADSISQKDFNATGETLTISGLAASQYADVEFTSPDGRSTIAYTGQADDQGDLVHDAWKWGTVFAQPGVWKVRVETPDYQFGTAEFTVTGTSKPQSDKDELRKLVESAGNLKESDYTADSWKTLSDALADAQAVLDNAYATQGDIDAATSALRSAIDALVKAGEEPAPNPGGNGQPGDGGNGQPDGNQPGGGSTSDGSGDGTGTASGDQSLATTGTTSTLLIGFGALLTLAGTATLIVGRNKIRA